MKTRLNIWLCIPVLAMLVYMILGIYRVSVVEGEKWKNLANSQQLKSTVVTASRGSIYDANGNVLAQSSTVYTIFVDPVMLQQQLEARDDRIDELREAIKETKDPDDKKRYEDELGTALTSSETFDELVEFLSVKLELDTVKVKKKLRDTSSQYVILKKEVDKTLRDEIDNELTKLKIDGVRGEPNTRRVYPQNSLAAHVIGHTNYDGSGLYGLEAKYDNYLSGVDGRVITAKDKDGNDIPYRYKQSYDAQDGNDLVLNIDINIQYMLEKSLEKAYREYSPAERICAIIMNPKTGQVYAMATCFGYDPNDPYVITDKVTLDMLSGMDPNSKQYEDAQMDAWNLQWKNKAVSELYYPGSVFKIITGSAALEEKKITTDEIFYCNSSIHVEDRDISCWTNGDHGPQNLALAMTNSCNPAFIQIGLKLGAEDFIRYFDGFGYTELSGIDLPGEINSYTMPLSKMGLVELATSSFGQTNKITPIQMITGISAAVNGGYVVTPQVVNTIRDSNGNIVKKNEPVIKRQIISEETSATMRGILQEVVDSNPSSNCHIPGYKIGGKSGTSQKLDIHGGEELYVGSYCAFVPADDPELIMLALVDQPMGSKFYGSQVAAPICKKVLSEVLPYMGFFPVYTPEELANVSVTVPSVQYYTVEEARKTLAELGFEVKIKGEGDTVLRQTPSSVKIEHGGSVVLYTDDKEEVEMVTVPGLEGLTREQAKEVLEYNGLNLASDGLDTEDDVYAQADQSYAAGTAVPIGTAVSVSFDTNVVTSQ